MALALAFIAACIAGILQSFEMADHPGPGEHVNASENTLDIHSRDVQLTLYKRLFKQNHAIQIEAVKSLLSYQDYAKQYQMAKLMLDQIFKVNAQAQQTLISFGFMPGDPFPTNDSVKEAYSKVLENTAMFGEMILRLPDIVHKLFDNNKEWKILISWSLWFCNESNALDEVDHKFFHLISQEIGLVEKDENFVNPFTSEYQINEQRAKLSAMNENTPKKKKQKIRRKGPRMSSRSSGEL